ncbi:hypothetical protein [Chryseobacterium bernardetii]|uniref:hypothetical protein n=1 Tax=Chryseobacterium bernardetii TaxID=1241978 RepID=UPI00162352E0|nr:hypothetical protein [Chryseobacterium bernardetii]
MYCNGVDEATLIATLEAKFEKTEDGWENLRLKDEISSRENYKNSQSDSGKIGQFWKKAKKILQKKEYDNLRKTLLDKDFIIEFIQKNEINTDTLKGLLKGLFKHSAIANAIEDIDTNINSNIKINNKIEFSVFWDLYDKKVGDKSGCKKKWDKLSHHTQNKIIDTLPSFKSKIEDKKYQPHPATYLNQERWNDETITSAKVELIPGETEEERFHREWKAKNKVIPLH